MEEKKKLAVALQYDKGDDAPRVVAMGKGIVADRIIEKADETEVPVYEDEKLAKSLSSLDIGDSIPEELYEVVAEILVFVDRLDRLRGKVLN